MYRSETDSCSRCKRKTKLIDEYCESCYEHMMKLWMHQSSRSVEELEMFCMNGSCEFCNR